MAIYDSRAHLRFHGDFERLSGAFGTDPLGKRAESFARFFGTPPFILLQTALVVAWIVLNATHVIRFDLYPFILLNLGFSLQAAYAAPLILLAQTRQADRDKAHVDADARHREDLSRASIERKEIATRQGDLIQSLLEQNTSLTEQTKQLAEHVEALTREIHTRVTAAT